MYQTAVELVASPLAQTGTDIAPWLIGGGVVLLLLGGGLVFWLIRRNR